MKTHMTEAEKRVAKARQFQSDLDQMEHSLTTIGFLSDDKRALMTFYRWLCFDKILQQHNQESEHSVRQFQTHLADFHFAFNKGLKNIKITTGKQKKIDAFWQQYQNLDQQVRS